MMMDLCIVIDPNHKFVHFPVNQKRKRYANQNFLFWSGLLLYVTINEPKPWGISHLGHIDPNKNEMNEE